MRTRYTTHWAASVPTQWVMRFSHWTLEIIRRTKRRKAMLQYLLDYGKKNEHWKVAIENREPAEASNFATNYLAVRAATRYGTAELKTDIAARRNGSQLLVREQRKPRTQRTKSFAFYWPTSWAFQDKRRKPFVRRLLDEQLAGGGWAQKAGMKPDAYATASVLVALNKAGGISVAHGEVAKRR